MTTRPKPGSKADRDALRREMTRFGCATAEIAVEMRTRWRMRPREAWRHALGLTLQDAADKLNDLGARHPGQAVAADASLLGKWEKWPVSSGRRPTLSVLVLLAELYGCEVEDLLDLEDRRALPESHLRVLRHTAAELAQGREAAAPATEPRTLAERPTDPQMVRAAAAESAAWAQWAESTNVGGIALEQLMADARTLAGEYLTDEPIALFQRTRALRDRTFALLEGHQHPRQSSDLYVAAGYLCGLLAWMTSDLGVLGDADTQGRTAWLCAELSGHNDLRAWVLSTRSKIAFWDGRLRDAINYARRGATYEPHGTVSILLACQEADAWSQLGAADEAQAAIARAADARARITGADEIGGLFSCPDIRHANYAAAVHLRTGDPRLALAEAQQALAGEPFHAYGTTAQLHIAEATAHLALREPDGTAEAVRPVLDMPADRRLAPVTARMQELARAMAYSSLAGSRSVVTLQGEIEAFCTESAAKRLALSPGDSAS